MSERDTCFIILSIFITVEGALLVAFVMGLKRNPLSEKGNKVPKYYRITYPLIAALLLASFLWIIFPKFCEPLENDILNGDTATNRKNHLDKLPQPEKNIKDLYAFQKRKLVITGNVRDSVYNSPIVNVQILLDTFSVLTDSAGNFTLNLITERERTDRDFLIVSKKGYNNYSTLMYFNSNEHLTIFLKQN